MSKPERRRSARRWIKLFYGMGSLAFGVKDNSFSVLLLLYYNQVLGLPAALAGGAVAGALVVDSVLDPLVGYLSDNLRSHWGRRHPLMYAAALPAPLSFLLLWNPPAGLGTGALAGWLFVTAVLVRSFITLYEIPSSALGPEISEDYDERTSIMAFRYLFGWVGGVTMYVLAFAVFLRPGPGHPVGQLNPAGYHAYAVAAAAVMFFSILVSAIGTHAAIPTLRTPPERRRIPPLLALREIGGALANPSALALLACGMVGGLLAGLALAATPYFNTYFWRLSSQQIAVLGLGSYASAALAMTVAPWLSRRFGKKRAAVTVSLAYAALAPVVYLLRLAGLTPPDGSAALLALLLASSVVVVGLSIVPSILVSAMISDVVEDNELRTGRRTEGVLFAANAFLLKCVSGLGVASTAALLSAVRFPRHAAPGQVPQPVLTHLALIYIAVVGGLSLLWIGFVSRYRISRAQHDANLAALAAQAEAASRDDPRLTAPAA